MTDPVSLIARKIKLRKHSSTVPTSLIPLSEVKRATVFVDSFDPDSDPACFSAKKFFSSRGISVNIICPQKWDISLFGWIKRLDESDPDLFVSLAWYDNFAAEYAARCSTARSKIGRRQLPGNVFDIVLTNPEDQLPLQHKAFEDLMELLLKVE